MFRTKKAPFVFCFLFWGAMHLAAQNAPVSSGGVSSGTGGSATYSIGQTDFITENSSDGIITQGVQQPYEIIVVSGIEISGINLSFSVFPNPTSDFITLSVKDLSTENMNYALYDVRGKLIKEDKLSGSETTITLGDLSNASYLIMVIDNKKEIKTFRIIKN
ncbi:MAG: T9SS type A sorting domain-containing protein [Bacteroidota bacterium]